MQGMTLKQLSHWLPSLYGCTLLLLVSCSDDALVDFSNTEESSETTAYALCEDNALFERDQRLETSDFTGAYVKTRELVCGIVGCNEVPIVLVQYEGFSPELVLNSDGTLTNEVGPFERFETWTFRAADESDVPNRFELIDTEAPENTYQVTVLEAGPCRIRVENVQGWIEYARLEEV